jgi:hypothetical protein
MIRVNISARMSPDDVITTMTWPVLVKNAFEMSVYVYSKSTAFRSCLFSVIFNILTHTTAN